MRCERLSIAQLSKGPLTELSRVRLSASARVGVGCAPKKMQCEWLGERVATVDITRAISNVINNKEDAGWGPNAVFRFDFRHLQLQPHMVSPMPLAYGMQGRNKSKIHAVRHVFLPDCWDACGEHD